MPLITHPTSIYSALTFIAKITTTYYALTTIAQPNLISLPPTTHSTLILTTHSTLILTSHLPT